MVNHIDNNGSSLVQLASQMQKTNKQSSSEGSDSTQDKAVNSASLDKVSVTGDASRLKEVEAKLEALPAVDSAKVAEIKQAIADGSYEINPERIAEKLLAFDAEATKGNGA